MHSNRNRPGATWMALLGLMVHCAAGVAAETNYLSDRPELIESSTQGWGTLGFDMAADGSPLRIAGQHFTKGIGTHADGVMVLAVDGQYESFDALVGIHPCGGGKVIFRVVADGHVLFDSGLVQNGDAPKPVHVSLAGAQEVWLESKPGGDGIGCDMANWAEARLTRATNIPRGSPAIHVDMAPFARVVTWDPARKDGARAGRIEEFRAEDLFTETDLLRNRHGFYTPPKYTNGVACIGLQWLNRRALREVALDFEKGISVPAPDSVRLEGWFGESAWQGNWKPLTNECHAENQKLIFDLAAKGGAILTQKIRWILPASSNATLVRLSAFTRSSWHVTNIFAQIDAPPGGAHGEVAIWNGAWAGQNSTPEISWRLTEGLHLAVRYSGPSLISKSDPTELQFHLPTGDVTVAVADVLANDCVYVPNHHLFVAREPLPVSLIDYKKSLAGKKTILQEVRARPDQTFAEAMAKTHHDFQDEGPVLLSLACDNAKFAVTRDGGIRFPDGTNILNEWMTTAGEMRLQFSGGPQGTSTRTLAGGWLPIPVITRTTDALTLREESFVAPFKGKSLFVAEFTLSNNLEKPVDFALSLTSLLNAQTKKAAQFSRSENGWAMRGDSGEIGLVTSSASISSTSNGLSFAGKLSAGQKASVTVYLTASPGSIVKPPGAAPLRADTETYWKSIMAPAIQIETPDERLNNIIRSSQVRCLIAARNEDDGARVAAWIAATFYGPLESESHSVIRGMAFMGHEDFARRSLDFFIHRYNTNGFLTTGYTTFGTAWHLWTLGQQYELYRDKAWLQKIASEITHVGHWIVRQLEKTKQRDANGQPLPEYGLMPPGVLADWNAFAYHYTMNGYYYAALRELGTALEDIRQPDASMFTRSAADLRGNILRAYAWTQAQSPVLPLRDGTWIEPYPSQVHSPGKLADFFPGQDGGRSWCYDVELGASQLAPAGILEPASTAVSDMMNHMEDTQFLADGWFDYPASKNHEDWFDLGGFSKVQPYYTRNAEIDALRHDTQPFIRSYFNTLAAMVNPEVLTIWEHFHFTGAWDKTHETGNFLYQTRTMFVQEEGRELWLAALVTTNWLNDGQRISVSNAPTYFGKVSYEIESHLKSGYITATIGPPARQAPEALVLRLRHPEGKSIKTVTVNGVVHGFDAATQTIRLVPKGAKPLVVRIKY